MSSVSQAEVVARLREMARRAANAADSLEQHAASDSWAKGEPAFVDWFALSGIWERFKRGEIDENEARSLAANDARDFTKAEVAERNEGLRCALLLAERALSAVHLLSAPASPTTIETNARAACAGWGAVAKADVLPLNPERSRALEPDSKNREAADLMFALLWEVRLVYGKGVAGRPHEAHNVKALLARVSQRYAEVFPGEEPIPEPEATALLSVMYRNPGRGRTGVPERFAEFLAAWLGLDNASETRRRPIMGRPGSTPAQRLAEAVLKASYHGGKRVAVTPYTERQRKKSQKHRGKVRAAPRT